VVWSESGLYSLAHVDLAALVVVLPRDPVVLPLDRPREPPAAGPASQRPLSPTVITTMKRLGREI
jgi:hypothetical protein